MKLDIDKDIGLHLPAPGNKTRCFIGLLSLLLILLLAAYLSYKSGYWLLRHDLENPQDRHDAVQLSQTKQKFDALKKELIALSRDNSILKATNKALNEKLLTVEDELTESRKKQLLYTDILASDDLNKGLHIRHFGMRHRINQKGERRYHYTVILSQAKGGKKIIEGQYIIRITGKLDGKQASYTHRELAADGIEAERKFSLRYYQSLEGDIVIPEGFEPDKVTLWIIPKSKTLKTQRKSYQWKPLISESE